MTTTPTATTALNTLTDNQEKAIEALVNAQAPVVTYIRKAVDYVETSIPDLPTKELGEKLPTIKQFVDNQFLFATKMLEVNHKFVLDLLDATKPVAEKIVVQKPAAGVRKVTKAPARKRTAAAA
jgi:tRNA U34 5-carboxymethylaminomethyl modifying GTPase MnmE/TrmE